MLDTKSYGSSKYGQTSVGLATPGAFFVVFEAAVAVCDSLAGGVGETSVFAAAVAVEVDGG